MLLKTFNRTVEQNLKVMMQKFEKQMIRMIEKEKGKNRDQIASITSQQIIKTSKCVS